MKINNTFETPFVNKIGIFQDGTIPFYRDEDGNLWAMSGHSHMGHIGMFKGKTLNDMQEVYPINLNFCVGHMDYAFDKVRYPEGVKARGSIWPFGLFIAKKTHRFFCFFHNETGWNGKGTGYDSYGYCDTPNFDTDFRHIGLMHSDDEGKNWTFDRWIITAEDVCFHKRFNPDAGKVNGQEGDVFKTGCGDFTLFEDRQNGYLYIFYNIIETKPVDHEWVSCNTYVARTRIRDDGVMGDFVKFYDDKFQEAGNLGKETAVLKNAWHPRVVYVKKNKTYYLVSNKVRSFVKDFVLEECMQVSTSKDLLRWTEPIYFESNNTKINGHYFTLVPHALLKDPFISEDEHLDILVSGGAADVKGYDINIDLCQK